MQFKKAPLVNVVRREQKEQKITGFLKAYIATAAFQLSGGSAGNREFLLLARSPDSPVAKSIAGLNREIQSAGIALRVIFSQIGSDAAADAWTNADGGINFAREIRIFDNPALLDVHEQLILGSDMSWVGDCLRRDPQRNDAYECYADSCQATASRTSKSFERLWLKAECLVSCGGVSDTHDCDVCADPKTAQAEAGVTYGEDRTKQRGPMAATRH